MYDHPHSVFLPFKRGGDYIRDFAGFSYAWRHFHFVKNIDTPAVRTFITESLARV